MMKPTLLVLAAGIGSRYGGLKQLDEVGPGGETIMDYAVYDAARAGFGKVVFVIRRDIEAVFHEAIVSRYINHIPVECVCQELDCVPEGFAVPASRKKPWGTGHAILVAADAIREPFAVVNGDDFYGAASFRAAADCLSEAADTTPAGYCMVGFILRNTLSDNGSVARGICSTNAEGELRDVVETLQIERDGDGAVAPGEQDESITLTGDEIASMNMWGFTPSIFRHLEVQFGEFLTSRGNDPGAEFFIPTVVNNLVRAGKARVKILPTSSRWMGVTYREDKAIVEAGIRALVDAGEYPPRLWA